MTRADQAAPGAARRTATSVEHRRVVARGHPVRAVDLQLAGDHLGHGQRRAWRRRHGAARPGRGGRGGAASAPSDRRRRAADGIHGHVRRRRRWPSRTAAAASTSVACVDGDAAPSAAARASAGGETSTATTRAPSAAAIITADRPTPPQPNTATHSPGRDPPCTVSARKAVAKRQPSEAAATKSSSAGRATRLKSARSIADLLGERAGPGEPGLALVGADLRVTRGGSPRRRRSRARTAR